MKKQWYLLLAVALPLAVACSDSGNEESGEQDHPVHDHEVHQDSDDETNEGGHSTETQEAIEASGHHGASGGLVLDNGKKWKADATTNEGVFKMQQSVESFIKNGTTAVEEYRQLGEELSAHFAELVRKCTMQGEAQDQLHVFLEQLQPKIKALQTAEEADRAHQVVEETSALLMEYFRFFE